LWFGSLFNSLSTQSLWRLWKFIKKALGALSASTTPTESKPSSNKTPPRKMGNDRLKFGKFVDKSWLLAVGWLFTQGYAFVEETRKEIQDLKIEIRVLQTDKSAYNMSSKETYQWFLQLMNQVHGYRQDATIARDAARAAAKRLKQMDKKNPRSKESEAFPSEIYP